MLSAAIFFLASTDKEKKDGEAGSDSPFQDSSIVSPPLSLRSSYRSLQLITEPCDQSSLLSILSPDELEALWENVRDRTYSRSDEKGGDGELEVDP
jgi:hypothetical protein